MNTIKNNVVLKPLFNETKIFYENNNLEITLYNKIYEINEKEIILEKITIIGNQLKVIYIDKYLIRIHGNIDIVKRGNYNEI